MKTHILSAHAGAILATLFAPLASGAIVVTVNENNDGVGIPANNPGVALTVSSTDLVNAGQPTLASSVASGFTPFSGSSPTVLNDGLDGGWNTGAPNTAVTTQAADWSLTYTLGLAGAPLGYDITGIDVMSLWTADYVNQRYSVEVSTVTVPSFTALTIGDVVGATGTSGGNPGSSVMSSLRDSVSGDSISTGVTGIRFTFKVDSGNNHHAAYREIDVFGVATVVPEPSTSALALLAFGFLGFRRQRS